MHALDAAVLFRLALEQAPAGTAWHAVADEGDRVRDIAAVIGRRLGLPIEPVPAETFGLLGPIFATDPARLQRRVAAMGCVPSGRRHWVLLIQGTPTGTRGRRRPVGADPG